MYEFDEDTRVEQVSPGRFAGTISKRWDIGTVPNGGYVLAVGLAAVKRTLVAPDPISVTAHFLRPAVHGDVEVFVDVAKTGRSYSTAAARLVQGSNECVRLIATYGDLSRSTGPTHVSGEPPEVPPLSSPRYQRPEHAQPEIGNRFEFHLAAESVSWMHGQKSGDAEIRGWVRFADGRPSDVSALPLFADAFPPPVFNVIDVGWMPTIELTVHVRARPTSDWLRCKFRTRFMFGGHFEEDGEIWDQAGTLVALSRQIATVPRR